MANATNATAGDVQLAGDIGGNNDATAPQLTSVGVTPGSYTSVNNIQVDAKGRILSLSTGSLPIASTTEPGVVQIGDGLNVSGGVVSIAPATNTTLGGVKSANTDYINITSGEINVGDKVAKLDQVNVFEKHNQSATAALTSGTNITVDGSVASIFTLVLSHNATLDNPTILYAGRYTFIIKQDGVGGRTLSYGSKYVFTGSGNVIQPDANSVTIITALSDGTNLYCSLAKNFA